MSNTNDDFLDSEYEIPKGEGNNYLKFKAGDTKFQIVSRPMLGWIDWKNNKPLRFPLDKKPSKPVDPEKPIKHFWVMAVWHPESESIKILEITQKTVQSAIKALSMNPDWGSPFNYQLTVTRKGSGKEGTEYFVVPSPKSPLPEAATLELVRLNLDMEALWRGEDPFANAKPKESSSSNSISPQAQAQQPSKPTLLKTDGAGNNTKAWDNIQAKINAGTIVDLKTVTDNYIVPEELLNELAGWLLPF